MIKGLEAIKRIKWKLEDEGILGKEYELCDDVKKELKALEIILNYVPLNVIRSYLEKEEQDLLKEVML